MTENEAGAEEFLDKGKPNVNALVQSRRETISDLSQWLSQQRDNYDVRHCLWGGQTADGRKHGTNDKPAFPWEGASDLRPFVVDSFISQDVALLCTSVKRANLVANPVESGDMARARLVSQFMRWLMYSQMEEIEDETELLANYVLEKGVGAMAVVWDRKTSTRMQDISVDDIAQLAPELAEFIQNKDYASDLTDLMQTYFPQISRRKARKMVTELRNKGRTRIGLPEVVWDRPALRALSLDRDLFVPIGTTDIQKAPYIFEDKWYTPDQLRAKVLDDGWDKQFVEYVINTQRDDTTSSEGWISTEWDSRYGVEANNKTENIRMVCAYYRTSDEDGVPEVRYTIFHPEVGEIDGIQAYAKHEVLPYRPQRYPFVLFTRERISRRALETRGYPEIAKNWQDQIKIERDSRIDRGSLATKPPLMYPNGRKLDSWGPASMIPYRRSPDEYKFGDIPPMDSGSIEIENNLVNTARQYFGRATSELDQNEARVRQEFMIQRWLSGWKIVYRHVWLLWQQFGPEQQFFRVTGAGNDPKMLVVGDEQEKYDFHIEFDVKGIDPDYNLKKLKEIGDIAMQFDRSGRTNWSALLGEMISGIDPSVAGRILMPEEEATEKEVEEEKQLLTEIYSGMDVDLEPPFNAQLRQQVFQSWLQGSETIPAVDVQQRLQTDEAFAKRVQKHQQQIQMQIMQQQNAQIGRTGATQGNL